MATLVPTPGSAALPAQPGQQIAILPDPFLPPPFGTGGTIELVTQTSGTVDLNPDHYAAEMVVTTLPANITEADGPFILRVTPALPLPAPPIEGPLVLAPPIVTPSAQTAVDALAGKLQLLADLDGQLVGGLDPVVVQPANQPLSVSVEPLPGAGFQVLSAPAPKRRRANHERLDAAAEHRPRASTRRAPHFPRSLSATATATIELGGLPTAIAGPLAGAAVTVQVSLTVNAGPGATISEEEADVTPSPTTAAFAILAAPNFVEQKVGSHEQDDPAARRLTLDAQATVTAGLPGGGSFSSPPVPLSLQLQLMPLELPTMLALFRHANYVPQEDRALAGQRDGFALLVVPDGSNVPPEASDLGELLNQDLFDSDQKTVSALATKFKGLSALKPVIAALEAFLDKVAAQPHFGVVKGNQTNLKEIKIWTREGLRNDIEAENEISSVLLLGRPNTVATLYARRDFKDSWGGCHHHTRDPAAG